MDITFGAAFIAGVLSFVSPCVLPVVPVYLGSLCGPELFKSGKTSFYRVSILAHSLAFVVGLGIVFTLLGMGFGFLGTAFSRHINMVRQIAGGLLIVLGLLLLASARVPWLNFEKRIPQQRGIKTGYFRSLATGGIFALAWTPCVGPVLGGILALAWSSQTAWHGAYLLAAYSLGLGIPFIITGAVFNSIQPLLNLVRRYSNWVYLVSAVLLITVGILVLLNRLTIFTSLAY